MNRSGARLTLISMLVILLAVLLAALLAALTPESQSAGAGPDWSPSVTPGRLPGFEDSPVNNDGRYFYYQLCKEVVFKKPDAPGSVLIENTPGNAYHMRVEYELDGYGITYISPAIAPGEHLLEDTLDQELPEGSYDVVAKVNVYDATTGETKDVFSENITVVVKNKLF